MPVLSGNCVAHCIWHWHSDKAGVMGMEIRPIIAVLGLNRGGVQPHL
jgi:hypothetical protein